VSAKSSLTDLSSVSVRASSAFKYISFAEGPLEVGGLDEVGGKGGLEDGAGRSVGLPPLLLEVVLILPCGEAPETVVVVVACVEDIAIGFGTVGGGLLGVCCREGEICKGAAATALVARLFPIGRGTTGPALDSGRVGAAVSNCFARVLVLETASPNESWISWEMVAVRTLLRISVP